MEGPSYDRPPPLDLSPATRRVYVHSVANQPAGASGIAYVTIVSLILAARYLDVVRWGFKLTWMALGTTVAAEIAGKTLLNNGIASQLRPKKYYQISRETVDTLIGDVHELANFFFLEGQKILYAENIYASTAVSRPSPLLVRV